MESTFEDMSEFLVRNLHRKSLEKLRWTGETVNWRYMHFKSPHDSQGFARYNLSPYRNENHVIKRGNDWKLVGNTQEKNTQST